jgi:hypothetical protein
MNTTGVLLAMAVGNVIVAIFFLLYSLTISRYDEPKEIWLTFSQRCAMFSFFASVLMAIQAVIYYAASHLIIQLR